MQIELALLHQLHDRRPGEQLAIRADEKERAIRRDRDASIHVGVAIAFGKDQFTFVDNRDHCAGDMFGGQLLRQGRIEKGCKGFRRLQLRRAAVNGRCGQRHSNKCSMPTRYENEVMPLILRFLCCHFCAHCVRCPTAD